MSINSALPLVKLSAVVFASTALVFGLKYYEGQDKITNLQNQIKLDKKTYSNDLKEIFERYDREKAKNESLFKENESLSDVEEVRSSTAPVSIAHFAKKNVKTKRSGFDKMKYDSLNSILNFELEENRSLSERVNSLSEKNIELQKINSSNESILLNSKNLTAINVVANGVKIVGNNNIINTKRFNAMEQIKVCFTLLENRAAIKGNKDIYIQIINPNNKIVSKSGESLEINDRLLHYSAKTNIYYDNDEMDVCVFVDPNRADILKGDYEINIFSGITQIGSTVFTLK